MDLFKFNKSKSKPLTNYFVSIHDKFGIYLEASNSIKDILFYDESDVLGKSAYDFFHPLDLSNIIKSHVSYSISIVRYRIRNKIGEYVYVKTISYSIKNENIYCITTKMSIFEILRFYFV